jgi:hypothetical protein
MCAHLAQQVDTTISIENQVATILSVCYVTYISLGRALTRVWYGQRLSGIEQHAKKSAQDMSKVGYWRFFISCVFINVITSFIRLKPH